VQAEIRQLCSRHQAQRDTADPRDAARHVDEIDEGGHPAPAAAVDAGDPHRGSLASRRVRPRVER